MRRQLTTAGGCSSVVCKAVDLQRQIQQHATQQAALRHQNMTGQTASDVPAWRGRFPPDGMQQGLVARQTIIAALSHFGAGHLSHYQQLRFVELASTHLPGFFRGRDVLEVGSWIANHTVRDYFTDCHYVGADVAEGPGVDVVCPGEKLDFPDASFDVAISVECFEHNPAWEATFENMVRMLRPGGLCLITCASIGRREHGTGRRVKRSSLTAMSGHQDYYMNLSKSDLGRVAQRLGAFAEYRMLYNAFRHDLYFVGIKRDSGTAPHLPPTLLDEAARITEERPPSFLRALRKRIKFALVFGFARLLGERTYHNLNHWVRSGWRS